MLTKILVEAGAGCGKTTSIVQTFQRACSFAKADGGLGLAAKDILLLTFTEAAAKEMRARIERDCPEVDLSQAFIGTFHAFCLRLLRNSEMVQVNNQKEIYSEDELAILHRARFLAQLAAKDKLPELMSALSLASIMDLTLKGSASKIPISDEFEKLQVTWDAFATRLARKLNSLDDESFGETDWPRQALQLLEQKNLDARIVFSQKKALKALGLADPELLNDVKRLRDLQAKSILTPLLGHWHAERDRLSFLHAEVQSLRETLPHALTFAEIERLTVDGLKNGTVKAPQYRLVIIDEFQDTSPEQWEIIEHISTHGPSWYLVGDPKQSIYAFRKADIRLYSRLRENLTVQALEKNYRSAPELLSFVNALQRNIFNEAQDPAPQTLVAGSDTTALAKPVRIFEYSAQASLHELVQRTIAERDAQAPDLRHAVLFREWKGLYAFAEFLTARGQAYRVEGADNYLDHFLSKTFIEFLLGVFGENPKRLEALKILGIDLSEARLKYFCEHQDVLTAFYDFCWHLQPERWPQGTEWIACMERLLHETALKGFYRWIDVLQILRKGHDVVEICLPAQKKLPGAQITLLTVHGAKGLEFDCVYLADPRESASKRTGFEEDEIPFTYPVSPQQKSRSLYFELRKVDRQWRGEAEQKRLFYVAITRAKRSLDFFLSVDEPRKTARDSNDRSWTEIWKGASELERFKWGRTLRALKAPMHASLVEWVMEEGTGAVAAPTFIRPRVRAKRNLQRPFPELSQAETSAQVWGKELHSALEFWNGADESLTTVIDRAPESIRAQLRSTLTALRKHADLAFYWSVVTGERTGYQVFREEELIENTDAENISRADVLVIGATEAWIIDWKSAEREAQFDPLRIAEIERQLQRYGGTIRTHLKKVHLLAVGIFREASASAKGVKTLLRSEAPAQSNKI